MKELILLGAGASVEAGIPDAYGMTQSILNKLEDYSTHINNNVFNKVANFVIGGLLFQKGVKGQNPLKSKVDIEEFFNAILLLADRDSTELAPFVGSWHYVIEELDKIQSSSWESRRFIDEICSSFRRPSRLPSSFQLETSFRMAIEGIIGRPGRGSIFHELSAIMISMLHNLIWIKSPEHVSYLRPLIKKAKDYNNIIATLNYDNTIELASQSEGVACNTCIDKWIENDSIAIEDDKLNLLKLHGSIDWKWIPDTSASRYKFSYRNIGRLSEGDINEGNISPAIIFGKSKLTTEGPFLDLLRTFKQVLNDSNRITIIGYSFRDDHINNYLTQWLHKEEYNFIRIIDPGFEDSSVEYIQFLKKIRKERPNRIEIINENTNNGLLLLYSIP